MFLSTAIRSFFPFLLLTCACSLFQAPPTDPPGEAIKPASPRPFEISEPSEFQAEIVMTAGGSDTRFHYSRRAGKWRLDTFEGEEARRSLIYGEQSVYIDHRTRSYSEAPRGPLGEPEQNYVKELTERLIAPPERVNYEELGSEGTVRIFEVVPPPGSTAAAGIIRFDTSIGMIVRHEMGDPETGGFVVELRDLKLEVSEEMFGPPIGYRKVSWELLGAQVNDDRSGKV